NQSYHECDIETMHQESRGTKRLVYSNNFDIYYTEDHYNTFIKVYSGEGQ
ncbi:ribonuclease domain-containing protein, partial [Sharpea azabuensis]